MRMSPLLFSIAAIAAPAAAEVPRVVTDLPAVASLAAAVMGDLGAPETLLERGGNAHSYQMRPSQARALQNADLVFWIGPEMTPWLDRAIDGITRDGSSIVLLDHPGTHRRTFAEGEDHDGHEEAQEHEEAHDAADGEAEGEAHHHDGIDPHAWLDPANAEAWLGVIAAALSEADPEHAATYAANAGAAAGNIRALDAGIAARLAPVKGKPFVVFHDAYGYFAEHYGLSVAGQIALGDAATPGAERIAGIRAMLQDSGAVCIFPEAQHDPKLVQSLAEGTDVRIGEALDPSGSSLEPGAGLYAALLTNLADSIATCLAGE